MKLNEFIVFDDETDVESDDDNTNNTVVCSKEDNDEDMLRCFLQLSLREIFPATYIPKGPIFNRSSNRHAPYQEWQTDQGRAQQDGGHGTDQLGAGAQQHIPRLPNVDVNEGPPDIELIDLQTSSGASSEQIRQQLWLTSTNGNLLPLTADISRIGIQLTSRKIGLHLSRVALPEDIAVRQVEDSVDRSSTELLFQPSPRSSHRVKADAVVEKSLSDTTGKTSFVLVEQYLPLNPFTISGIDVLLDGVTEAEVEAAKTIIHSQDLQELLKTYGPNKDSLLMTLCCKRGESGTVRAQIFVLCARILSTSDSALHESLVRRNVSGLSALDYATVTNNSKIAVFLTELFFIFGQDVYCRDSSGNTILHVMSRKGDTVAQTLKALLSLRFHPNSISSSSTSTSSAKLFSTNVANANKQFLPLHIAAMSARHSPLVLTSLMSDYPAAIRCTTSDGSIPLHLCAQYSSDPMLLSAILALDPSCINHRRSDGFTPLHLVAARNEAKDIRHGLIPLEETLQVQMIQILVEAGSDRSIVIEGYRPVDLIKSDREHAKALLLPPEVASSAESSVTTRPTFSLPASAGLPIPRSTSGMPMSCVSRPFHASSSRHQVSSSSSSSGSSSPLIISPPAYQDRDLFQASSDSDSASTAQRVPWAPSMPYSPSVNTVSRESSVIDNSNGGGGDVAAEANSDDDIQSGNGISSAGAMGSGEQELDAIAQALLSHPIVQAAVDAAVERDDVATSGQDGATTSSSSH